MVIGLAPDDGTGTVELFGEDEPHHLMGEGHAGERELLAGTGIDLLGEAVRSADDKHEPASRMGFPFYPSCELGAAQFGAMLVQQNHRVLGLQLTEDQLALGPFLLLFAEAFGGLQFWNGHQLEWHVMADALHVGGDASREMLVVGLAHQYQ